MTDRIRQIHQLFLHNHIGNKRGADAAIFAAFLFLALAYTLGRIGDSFYSISSLSGDAANIASFAAALDHPQAFAKDPLLSDADNFAFYLTIHIPLIRVLNAVFGNYGTASISFLFPVLLLQLAGFYYLGKTLYDNRWWAFILAIVTAVPAGLPLGEFWGFYKDPLPRIVFQALLPFLLGATLRYGKRTESWGWIMAGAGALTYVHPVSAPAWGIAILAGLWFGAPDIDLKSKLRAAFASTLIFLVTLTPFAVNYLTTFSHSQTKNYNQVLRILSYRFAPGYLDIPLAIQMFYEQIIHFSWLHQTLWIAAGLGLTFTIYLNRKNRERQRIVYVLAAWWGSLLLISAFVPWAEQEIMRALRRTPLEVDLIRGLRYIIPLLWLTLIWTVAEMQHALRTNLSAMHPQSAVVPTLCAALVGTGLAVAWANQNQFDRQTKISATYECWLQGKLACAHPEEAAKSDFLSAIKDLTPPGASIFFPDLAVRYYALRPITFIDKDGGALGYANHEKLLFWFKQSREMDVIDSKSATKSQALDAYAEFARTYGAEYFVLVYNVDYLAFRNGAFEPLAMQEEQQLASPQFLAGFRLVYRNSYGSLYEIIR